MCKVGKVHRDVGVKVNDVLTHKHSGKKFMVGKVYRNNEIMVAVEIEASNPNNKSYL